MTATRVVSNAVLVLGLSMPWLDLLREYDYRFLLGMRTSHQVVSIVRQPHV